MLIQNGDEKVVFDLFFTDFNGLLLELLRFIKPYFVRDTESFLLPIDVKPLLRIVNLYEYYVDGFVNENPEIFTTAHLHMIVFSGNEEVKREAGKIIEMIKNAHINCINQARRQHKMVFEESATMVDYILLAWEGALYQQRYSRSIKPLFVFTNLLKRILMI
jgi:hypothetical protein